MIMMMINNIHNDIEYGSDSINHYHYYHNSNNNNNTTTIITNNNSNNIYKQDTRVLYN